MTVYVAYTSVYTQQGATPKPLKNNIKAYCRENMAPYKVPKIIEFIDAIPLTAVGKVDKKALR